MTVGVAAAFLLVNKLIFKMLWDILILIKIDLVKTTLLKLILLKQEIVICVINLLEEKMN